MLNVAHLNNHPEVTQWIAKANANGGVYTSQTVNALRMLMTDLKRYNLRSKIYRLNMFVGQNSNAGAIPIIADKGNSIDTIVGSPLYTPNGGFNPNSANNLNYIRTGFVPATMFPSQFSVHQGCWCFSPYVNGIQTQQGCADATNRFSFHYPWSDGIIYSDMYGTSPGTSRSQTTSFAGFTIMQNMICTVNASVNNIYRNGAVTSQSATGNGSGTMPNYEYTVLNSMTIGNVPNTGILNNYRIGYYTLGTGLTLVDSFLYNKAVTDFMNVLGRS